MKRVTIGKNVVIGDSSSLGSCRIEDGAILGRGVIVEDGVVIGAHAIVKSGCILGVGANIGASAVLGEGVIVCENVKIKSKRKVKAGSVIRK